MQYTIINTHDPKQNLDQTWIFHEVGRTHLLMTLVKCDPDPFSTLVHGYDGNDIDHFMFTQGPHIESLHSTS